MLLRGLCCNTISTKALKKLSFGIKKKKKIPVAFWNLYLVLIHLFTVVESVTSWTAKAPIVYSRNKLISLCYKVLRLEERPTFSHNVSKNISTGSQRWGVSVFENDGWCNCGHSTMKEQHCCKDNELWVISMRPYYLPACDIGRSVTSRLQTQNPSYSSPGTLIMLLCAQLCPH